MLPSLRWLCAIATLLLAALLVVAGPLPSYDPSVTSLTEGNFTRSVDNGAWLIEFYSPHCGHCKRFAPTFHDLADDNRHLEDSSNFHIARVNCIAQGDLCTRHNIDAYPSLELFREGRWIESYIGDRSYEDLDAYIQARAADNRKLMDVFGGSHH